jgi:GGDEF domain-containing protein
MAMVSIKRYLNLGDDDGVMRQVVTLLLEKIAGSAVSANELECTAFRDDIGRIRDQFVANTTPDSVLVTAGSAAQAMETYNKGIGRFLQRQEGQLQSIVTMMTDTVVKIGGQHMRSAQRLQEIGDGIERAGAVGDFETLKIRLGECLNSFREETSRQKEETEDLIKNLRQGVEQRARKLGTHGKDLDSATGLAKMEDCIRAMREEGTPGRRRYVVTMVVNRMQSINARFGQDAGDRVLSSFGSFVEQQLNPTDKLFRWTGPAVVALLDRSESLDQVRTQIKRMLENRIEENFEVEERSVLIPISAAWAAFQLIGTVATAEKQIQTFIASQGSREYA